MDKKLHQYLSGFGVKPSLQRLAIMEYLMTHRTHPTADEIFNALSPVDADPVENNRVQHVETLCRTGGRSVPRHRPEKHPFRWGYHAACPFLL